MIHRLLEWLFGRGWGKGVCREEAPSPEWLSHNPLPTGVGSHWDTQRYESLALPNLLCGGRRHPHYYGRKDQRGNTCLRCGHERGGK